MTSDISLLTKEVGVTLKQFMHDFKTPDNDGSPVLNLGYRFFALSKFQDEIISPPTNMTWMFLFIHQLVYMQTAIKYPAACGLDGKSKQQIQTLVNIDLKALCKAKLRKEISREVLKGYKVYLLECF
jgi:hypothetical protein